MLYWATVLRPQVCVRGIQTPPADRAQATAVATPPDDRAQATGSGYATRWQGTSRG